MATYLKRKTLNHENKSKTVNPTNMELGDKGKLTSKVLCEDSNHSLHTAKDCPMDHYRVLLLPFLVHVAQVKPSGQLEVQLYSGTLMLPLESILQSDINLRPIECSVSRVELPWQASAI